MVGTVVHYIDLRLQGGCEEAVATLVSGIESARWAPILVHHDEPGLAQLVNRLKQSDIDCQAVAAINGSNRLQVLRQLTELFRQLRPEIVHAHLNWPLGCRFGVAAARLAGVPATLATAHLFSPIAGARFASIKHSIHKALIDRYLAVSSEVKRQFSQRLNIALDEIHVVYNGICAGRFAKPYCADLHAQLTGGRAKPIVFTSARLHPQKGLVHLLNAAVMVPNATFVIAGEGQERLALESLAERLAIGARVKFLGHRSDIPELLAVCDLFVLPSIYEGLGLSVIEAMAAGKPVIATNIGGVNEVVEDGLSGRLVPPSDPAALAAAINELLSTRDIAARFVAEAKKRVADRFSVEAMVNSVCSHYDELSAR